MIGKALLALSLVLVIMLSLRLLKRCKGVSLMAWEVLIFALALEPGALWLETINDRSALALVETDSLIVSKVVISLILVNLVAIGCFACTWRQKIVPDKLDRIRRAKFTSTPRFFWLGIAFVAAGTLSFLMSERTQLVLRQGLSVLGDYTAYYSLRYALGQVPPSLASQYLQAVGLVAVLPALTLYCLNRFLVERRRFWLRTWAILAFTWSAVALLSFAKQPIIAVLVSHIVLLVLNRYVMQKRKRRVRWKVVCLGACCMVLSLYAIYNLLGATESLGRTILLVMERQFVVPILTTYNHFVVFPQQHPHTYYQTSRTLNTILAGRAYSADSGLPPYYIASAAITGSGFNMNTGFVGAGWAEMGYIGVVQCAGIIFGLFTMWDLLFFKYKGYLPLIVLAAYFVGRGDNIANVDLFGMLITGGAVFAPLFMFVFCMQTKARGVSDVHPSRLIRNVPSGGWLSAGTRSKAGVWTTATEYSDSFPISRRRARRC